MKAHIVKGIYVVESVRLLECIRGAFASYQKIGVKTNCRLRDVRCAVVMDAILKMNLKDLLLALLNINPNKVKVTEFTINWSTILTTLTVL
jgi:hypothetical protein